MVIRNSSPNQDDFAASNNPSGEKGLHPALSMPSVDEIDFAELIDGSLVETIEDPEDSTRTLLAVYKDGEVQYLSRVQSGNRILVSVPRNKQIIKDVRLPRGVKACESARTLFRPILSIFRQCLDINEDHVILLAHFVMSTWFIEQLRVAPYLAVIGLPRSGKSTALRLLRLLCRRALLTSDISSAAFHRICDRITPTLLIDETGSVGEKRALFHLLKAGSTRDLVTIRKDESFKIFGAKAFSWIEPPNDAALNSRCLMIPLHETHRIDLKEPDDPQILQAADDIQKQLLFLRFKKHKNLSLMRIPSDDNLYSRDRDLYKSLALPFGEDKDICERLVSILRMQQESNREPLTPIHSAVLRFLFLNRAKLAQKGPCAISQLTDGVNFFLRAEGESFQLSPREVGSILTLLGFNSRKRTNCGWTELFDRRAEKRIQELATTHELCLGSGQQWENGSPPASIWGPPPTGRTRKPRKGRK